nr:PREDICTED: uncharacterized protein LOC109042796 [Bemisia tabaci]
MPTSLPGKMDVPRVALLSCWLCCLLAGYPGSGVASAVATAPPPRMTSPPSLPASSAESTLPPATATADPTPPVPVTINATIGFLIDLHRSDDSDHVCGKLNLMAVQQLLAAEWAVSVVNKQTRPVPVKMSMQIYDTCSNEDVAIQDIFLAMKSVAQNKSQFLGLIGVGDAEIVSETVLTLHAFKVPLILASPKLAEMVKQKGNILTTAPDLSSVTRPIASFAAELDLKEINLITSCQHTVKMFKNALTTYNIESRRILKLVKRSNKIGEMIKDFLDELDTGEAVAIILEPEEIEIFVNFMNGQRTKKVTLITGSIGLNKDLLKLWKNVFADSYFVEPHMPELPEFHDFVFKKLQDAKVSKKNSVLRDYLSAVHNCSWEDSCKSLTAVEIASHLLINPEVNFVVKAVSAFSAALYVALRKRCDESNTVCNMSNTLHEDILRALSHLSLGPANSTGPFQLPGTSIKLTHDGHLISNRFVFLRVGSIGDLTAIGWYSDDSGPNLNRMAMSNLTLRRHSTSEKKGRGLDDSSFLRLSLSDLFSPKPWISSSDGDVNVTPIAFHFQSRTWVLVMISLASLGILFTIFIFFYVLIKLCDKTIVGNQSFGILLLIGIAITYGSVILFILPASELRCSLRLFVYPLSLSLCFGILIVKLMQLKTLVLLGLGGRISYLNQYLILFFIVLVQFVISIQWFMDNGPHLRADSEKSASCYASERDFLILHTYIMILAGLAFLYGLTILKIRRNYKEGRWITLAAFLSLLVMSEWTAIRYFGSPHVQEPVVCISLIILPSILLLTIFIPKISTISKQSSYLKNKKKNAKSSATVFTTFSEISSQPKKETQWAQIDYSGTMSKNPLYEPDSSAYI